MSAYARSRTGHRRTTTADRRAPNEDGYRLHLAQTCINLGRLLTDAGVGAGAEAAGGYQTLNDTEAFHAEYWPLELYKLTLAPPEIISGRG